MSEDSNKKGNGESAPAAGELLARARQAREISLAEMAKELHLDEPKVRALEQNEFDALGAPVFAKGYLRKYAELVGVSEDDVIADYYRLHRSAGAPPLITKRPTPIRDFSAGPFIAAVGGLPLTRRRNPDTFVACCRPPRVAQACRYRPPEMVQAAGSAPGRKWQRGTAPGLP